MFITVYHREKECRKAVEVITEFLVRKFVKNYQNTEDHQVRTSYGVLSSIVGICCNVLLFIVKIVVGIIMGSISVMADAFNNLSDAASSIISFIGVKIAERPADKKHPFGHGRIEYISAFIVAFLVIQVGFSLFKNSFLKLREPSELHVEWFAFWILVISVGVKGWLAGFNRKLGKRVESKVMLATAADSMGDMVTTGATILSILIYRVFHINVDSIAGLIVSLLVVWAGIEIAKDTLEPLIGEPADPELVRKICTMVESMPGITGTHDLIIHNYGPNRSMATIHAEIPKDMNVEESHEIIDRAEREVCRKLGVFLVIHMDPVDLKDERIMIAKAQLKNVLEKIDPCVTFHDFRMAWGKSQVNLIFDVLVPYSYNAEQQISLKERIGEKMRVIDERYICVIDVDQSYEG